jgi:hypothetical protein
VRQAGLAGGAEIQEADMPEHGPQDHGTPALEAQERPAPHHHAHGPTGPGTVLLELGENTGALLLDVPADLNGHEIEISPAGEPGQARTHSQVRERPTPSGVRYAALYEGVPAGVYTVWRDASTAALTVTVTGAQVTTCRWPG